MLDKECQFPHQTQKRRLGAVLRHEGWTYLKTQCGSAVGCGAGVLCKGTMHSAGPSVHANEAAAGSRPAVADHFVQLPPVERAQTFVPVISQV
jgi:hypothetical protein